MITGVTKSFQYKMRAVYTHFPINCFIRMRDARSKPAFSSMNKHPQLTALPDGGAHILSGVTVAESTTQKDELILEEDGLQGRVSALSGTKTFFDDIYVSGKGTIVQDE
ncbi:60S ribosomal protein L9-like protein [Mycena crocata]|nr:60S ribosomal protein L9-like protein [Mycena crocata]